MFLDIHNIRLYSVCMMAGDWKHLFVWFILLYCSEGYYSARGHSGRGNCGETARVLTASVKLNSSTTKSLVISKQTSEYSQAGTFS